MAGLDDVDEVWHLAAVYDLAVAPEVARRVNVEGTRHVLEFCRGLRDLRRLQYVSTCYVSGRYEGCFAEDDLEEGQAFRNHYERTKYDAEVLVRAAMASGLPATVYRPGIVVGDSATGETQKYDGPYFLATFLLRQLSVAVVPALGDADRVRVCLVPRDFVVGAMDELSVLEESRGRTYALVDPDPPTVREVVTAFARHLGKRVVWVPLPLAPVHALVDHVPGAQALLGLPAEALVKGDRIEIRGFGSFSLNYRPPRVGRNPKSGDKVSVPEKWVPHFKAGKELRERVDKSLNAV